MSVSSQFSATTITPANGSGSPIKIRIRNFQSIEDVELVVDGFVCIAGKTNIGKSAIMRAISSSILNDPVVGKVRKGSQFCTVEVSGSGWGFKWEKGERGVNRYTIGDKVYDKIGQRQLDEIVSMGFGSIKVGDQEMQPWWSSQFFPLFLLDKSGPQVTDFISEVSRLTVLQDAIVISARGKRQALDEAKAKAEESLKLRDRLSRVSGLDPLVKLHGDMEAQAESIVEYESRLAAAELLDSKMKAAASKIRSFSGVAAVDVPDDKVGGLAASLAAMHGFWTTLEFCAKRIILMRDVSKAAVPGAPDDEYARHESVMKFAHIDELKRSVAVLDGASKAAVPADGLRGDVEKIVKAEGLAGRIAGLRAAVTAISATPAVPDEPDMSGEMAAVGYLLSVETLRAEAKALEAGAKKLGKELLELDDEIASIPACPTCDRPVGPEHAHPA